MKKLAITLFIISLILRGCSAVNNKDTYAEEIASITEKIQTIISNIDIGYSVDFAFSPSPIISAKIKENGVSLINMAVIEDSFDDQWISGEGVSYNKSSFAEKNILGGCTVSNEGYIVAVIAKLSIETNSIIFYKSKFSGVFDGNWENFDFTEEILIVDLNLLKDYEPDAPYAILTNASKTITPSLFREGDSFLDLKITEIDAHYEENSNWANHLFVYFEGDIHAKGALSYNINEAYPVNNGVSFYVSDESLDIIPYSIFDMRPVWFMANKGEEIVPLIGEDNAYYEDSKIIIGNYNFNIIDAGYYNKADIKEVLHIGKKQLAISEQDLFGVWQANNMVAAGYCDSYLFNDDGTFVFTANQMLYHEIKAYRGNWVLEGEEVKLSIADKIIEKNFNQENERLILPDGYTSEIEMIRLPSLETKILPLTKYKTELSLPYSHVITLDGVDFWDFSNDTNLEEHLREYFDEAVAKAYPDIDDLSFADLADLEFYFSSGVGAWWTLLHIEPDGSFSGYYNDADMGDIGVDYPNGTRYECTFSGKFAELKKASGHEYSLICEYLITEKEPGLEEIVDGVRIITSEPYGLNNANEFSLYLPGKRLNELPDMYLEWIGINPDNIDPESEDVLEFVLLYNINGGNGFRVYE